MKRILLSVLILFSLSQARASDTLTVRQVYSFNVGDTFDFSHNVTNYDLSIFFTQFYRTVISQKVISPGQDSITYNTNWVITNLDSIAVFQTDTLSRLDTNWVAHTNFLDTTSFVFAGAVSNDILSDYYNFGEETYSWKVTSGWGETYYQISNIDNSGQNFNTETVQLIYFSNGIQSWGTPYYDQYAYIHAGIADVKSLSIRVSPNPTTGLLHLSISDASQSNTQFIITDLLGQEVYSSPVTQSETTHDISKLASGIYTWRVVEDNSIIKTGKVLKE